MSAPPPGTASILSATVSASASVSTSARARVRARAGANEVEIENASHRRETEACHSRGHSRGARAALEAHHGRRHEQDENAAPPLHTPRTRPPRTPNDTQVPHRPRHTHGGIVVCPLAGQSLLQPPVSRTVCSTSVQPLRKAVQASPLSKLPSGCRLAGSLTCLAPRQPSNLCRGASNPELLQSEELTEARPARTAAWHCAAAQHRTAARHCAALPCTALHGTARHDTARHGTARHYTAAQHRTAARHCAALRCAALHCTALHGTARHYTTLLHGTAQLHSTTQLRSAGLPMSSSSSACLLTPPPTPASTRNAQEFLLIEHLAHSGSHTEQCASSDPGFGRSAPSHPSEAGPGHRLHLSTTATTTARAAALAERGVVSDRQGVRARHATSEEEEGRHATAEEEVGRHGVTRKVSVAKGASPCQAVCPPQQGVATPCRATATPFRLSDAPQRVVATPQGRGVVVPRVMACGRGSASARSHVAAAPTTARVPNGPPVSSVARPRERESADELAVHNNLQRAVRSPLSATPITAPAPTQHHISPAHSYPPQ